MAQTSGEAYRLFPSRRERKLRFQATFRHFSSTVAMAPANPVEVQVLSSASGRCAGFFRPTTHAQHSLDAQTPSGEAEVCVRILDSCPVRIARCNRWWRTQDAAWLVVESVQPSRPGECSSSDPQRAPSYRRSSCCWARRSDVRPSQWPRSRSRAVELRGCSPTLTRTPWARS
jgi:hypothetical protein